MSIQIPDATKYDAILCIWLSPTAHPRQCLALGSYTLVFGLRRWFSEPRYDNIDQSFGAPRKPFQNISLATSPFFLTHAKAELATTRELQATERIDGRVSMEQNIPAARETRPEAIEGAAELLPADAAPEVGKRWSVVKAEDGIGLFQLGQEEGWWTDFSGGVLRRWFCGRFGPTFCAGGCARWRKRGQFRKSDRLSDVNGELRGISQQEPTARIHQPSSSSLKTIRLFSVSMESTGSP